MREVNPLDNKYCLSLSEVGVLQGPSLSGHNNVNQVKCVAGVKYTTKLVFASQILVKLTSSDLKIYYRTVITGHDNNTGVN